MQKCKILIFPHRIVNTRLVGYHGSHLLSVHDSDLLFEEQRVVLLFRRHHRPVAAILDQILLHWIIVA